MIFKQALWKRVLCALFFFLISCTKTCPVWEYGKMDSPYSDFYSERLLLPPSNPFRGMSVELARTCSGVKAYLNAYSLSFPMDSNDPLHTTVCLVVEEKNWTFTADRLEGGQRLLLPEEARDLLISNLHQGKKVYFFVDKYSAEAIPKGFPSCF